MSIARPQAGRGAALVPYRTFPAPTMRVELGNGEMNDVPTPRGASTVAVWVENTP
jgi:hypothetical protein